MKRDLKFRKSMIAIALAAVTAVGALPVQAAAYTDTTAVSDAAWQDTLATLAASSVSVTESAGYEEGAYAEWAPVDGADGYNVYCDGVQIDSMLIRQYSGYFRADAVGLAAGAHTLKIVPTKSGSEMTSAAAEVNVTSTSYDRSGFCFAKNSVTGGTGLGAYNDDGTLKSDAVVLYVTEETKNTVTMDVQTSSSKTESCTGIGAILKAMQKGYETRPVAIRIVGKVTIDGINTSGDTNNLLIKASATDSPIQNITVEGIGEDAVCYGFGIRCQRARSIEIRNLAVMLFGDDGIALETDNYNIWVHNNDIFYGTAGSDADQAKGDGSMDLKNDSKYITISYNHFWDSGKMSLCGMKSETAENWISYHHNWFDHSDSRHPRIRTMSVHVYNNYYDGNSKYGVGVTTGACAFVENNYFRNCKYPMLISMQGSDIASGDGGTFSSENGGIIKSYNNYMEGQKGYVTYQENNTEFDAYEASSRDEQVPSSVTCVKGATTYNNFDTDNSIMYDYTPDTTADVPSIVMAKAGRLNGGDFDWEFNDAVDDEDYSVNTELMAAITSYTSPVIAIGSGFQEDSGTTPIVTTTTTTTTVTSEQPVVTTTTTAKGTDAPIVTTTVDTPSAGDLFCAPGATGSGSSASDPMDVEKAITTITAGHTIYLLEGTYAFSETIMIDSTNSGAAGAYKTIKAYNGADVTFDFSGQGAADSSKRGIVLDGDYWHFYGFEITKAADNGMLLSGSNNLIEMMVFNDNQDTGMQMSRYNTSAATIAEWPSYNTILNCTSKNNCDDLTMENADGFAPKLTCGEGNVFDGCMAYNNSDDGWDLYAKEETGPIGVVTLRNCVAFRNGYTEFGEGYGDCDGNGFKLGGAGVGTAHIVENCLAFENLNCGFTDNNNPKLGSLTDCTAYNNGVGGNGKANYMVYRCTEGCDFTDIISYTNTSKVSDTGAAGIKLSNDKFVGTIANSIYYNSKYWLISDRIDIANGDKGTTEAGISDSDFISLSVPAMGTDFHTAWRNADGSINTSGFAETVGQFESMGYHFTAGSTTPIVTTPTTTTTSNDGGQDTTTTTKDSTTTTTTKDTDTPIVAGDYVHDFTENGLNSTFFTISGNLSTSKGTVEYAGKTLTQCLKLETTTSITFTNTTDGSITLVFVEPDATINVDGTKYTADGSGIITVDVAAGAHTISKENTANLFYMVYASESAPVVTTITTTVATEQPADTTTTTTVTEQPVDSTTTTSTSNGGGDTGLVAYGDITLDGVVDLLDCIQLNKAMAQLVVLSPQANKNADVNASGGVDEEDITTLMQFVIMVIDKLPANA